MKVSLIAVGVVAAAVIASSAALAGSSAGVSSGGASAAPPMAETSLQAQIEAAPMGATLRISGTYRGGVVIRKPLRLQGAPGATIDAAGQGTVVRVEAPGVVLSGLRLRNSGRELNTEDAGVFVGAPGALLEDLVIDDVLFGLNLKGAHGATVRRVAVRGMDLPLSRRGDGIRLWYSDGVTITQVRLERVRDVLLWFARGTTLHAVEVRGSRYGVHLMYADETRVLESHFEDNAVGAYVMYSTGVRLDGNRILRHRGSTGVALAVKESDDILGRGNLLAGNHVGLYLDGTPRLLGSRAEFTGNIVAGNETGVQLLSSAERSLIAGNVLDDNALQVRLDGGAHSPQWTRGGRGNYWSDYTGLDVDGDGVGEAPYRARQWFEGLGDRMPETRLLWGSVAVAAVDFAARLLPIFAPQVLAEDPHPLTAVGVPEEFRGSGPSVFFALAALAVAAASVAAIVAARPWTGRRPAEAS